MSNNNCLIFKDYRKNVVLKDNRNPQVFKAKNNNSYLLKAYKVDNCLIKNGNKCDYLLKVINNSNLYKVYFIELKGQDLKHAIIQIEESIKKLNLCNSVEIQARVILNKVKVPALRTSYEIKFEKFLKKCHINSRYDRYKTNQKTEDI